MGRRRVVKMTWKGGEGCGCGGALMLKLFIVWPNLEQREVQVGGRFDFSHEETTLSVISVV